MPLYNRQQGNIAKARSIVAQNQLQLITLQRSIIDEVDRAFDDYLSTASDVERYERLIEDNLPDDPRMNPKRRRPTDAVVAAELDELQGYIYKNKLKDYYEIIRKYSSAVLAHRKSMLRLNTAVGRRDIFAED